MAAGQPGHSGMQNRPAFLTGRGFDTKFDVIVNATLYDSIIPALDTFVQDLARESYSVSVLTMSGVAAVAKDDLSAAW